MRCLRSLVVFPIALAGCAETARPPAAPLKPALTAPLEGGAPWRELVTPRFVLDTDVAEKDARAFIAECERAEDAILHHLHVAAAPEPTRVVLLARWRDFAKMKSRDLSENVNGYTGILADGAFTTPLIVMHTSASFSHELLHRLLEELMPNPPTWLDEGLATYYGTMSVEKDRIVFGKRVWTRGRSLELSALLAAREKEFAGSQGAHYYESAAALVSLFLDRSWAYRARYDRYIAALVSGERHDAAWAQAFGDVSLRRLQEDLLIYRRDGLVDTVEERYRTAAPPQPSARYLSDVEIHLLWLRLRKDGEGVRRDLEEARRQEPGSPDVAMYSGLLAENAERYDEAEADLRAARDAAPGDERFRLALFRYHLRRARATGAPFAPLEPEARALAADARHPETLNDVAYLFALAEHPDDGLPLARRAVALRPHGFGYLDTLALLLFEKGDVDGAVATEEHAMALVPDGVKQPGMAEHLERFKRAVAEKRGALGPREAGATSAPK